MISVPLLYSLELYELRKLVHLSYSLSVPGGPLPRTLKVKVLAAQSCPTLCDPMDCSPPGSSVHGILQARILDGLPFPSPGNLPDPGIKPNSPGSQAVS